MANIIYPSPGSFNDFCERNPQLTGQDRLRHLSTEMAMWRATGEDIDRERVRLTPEESCLRLRLERSCAAAGEAIRIANWPSVGEYEVPEELRRLLPKPQEVTVSR